MEFFDVMRQNLERSGSPLILINKETGEHVAQGSSYMELNEAACKELDNIFEKNVLLSE